MGKAFATQARLRTGLALVLLAGSAAAGLTPVADGDVFWHLAAGREMVRTHGWLASDVFSVSSEGRPWVDVHWLFQLAVFAVHAIGGLTALVLLKSVLVAVSALLLLAAVDRAARPLLVPILIAALLCARHLLLVRPVIVTLLMLAFFFLQLERFRRHGRVGLLVALPFAQIVWSNCQGLFALGPALVAAYAASAGLSARFAARPWFPFAPEHDRTMPAGRRLMPLLLTLVACLLGACVTPYGMRALALPIELLARLSPTAGNPYREVAENVPPFVLERLEPGQFWHLPWALALLVLGFAVPAGRLVVSHLLLLAGFIALALIANRNVLLLYWMAAPIVALRLAPPARRAGLALRRYRARLVARWLGVGVTAALLLVAGAAAAGETRLGEPAPFRFPDEAARIIQRNPGKGAIFSADHQGGYLIWKLYPRFKPYIDTRLVLRTPEEFSDYLRIARNPQEFDTFQQRHAFSYVVLPVVYPDRYLDLIAHLYESPAWKLIFTDGAGVLFAHSELTRERGWDLGASATTDRILKGASLRFRGSPRLLDAARLQLATLDVAVGELEQADRILSASDTPAARALRARARLAAGDLEGAQAIAERLLSDPDAEVQDLDLMAMVHMRRGRLQEATRVLRRALAIDPFDREAIRLLAAVEEHQHEP